MNKQETASKTTKKDCLLESLWEERRGRLPSQSLQPISLFITVPSKDVSVEEVFRGLFDTMVSSDESLLYKWASNWGQTRVTVHAQKNLSFHFMDRLSNEAKSYEFLTTKKLIEPGTYFCSPPDEQHSKYQILLNDAPVKIEGAILQAERMMDELVWYVCSKNIEVGMSESESYRAALTDVGENGFSYRYVSSEEILRLKQNNPDIAVRIYGDFLNKGTVPQIVGAVCPTGIGLSSPTHKIGELPIARNNRVEEAGRINKEIINNQLPFVAMGITLAKRPHVGHMLLAGIVSATSRSLGGAPICIDGNDLGPRINATIKYGARQLDVSVGQVIQDITDGLINTETIEQWYRNRRGVNDRTIMQDSKIEKQLSLTRQAEEALVTFRKFFQGTGVSVNILLESQTLGETSRFVDVGDNRWSGTGFGYVNTGNKLIILEREGDPSSEVVRAAFICSSAELLNRGRVYFVDSDPALKDVSHIYALANGQEVTQVSGTAIGFNFKIASGTDGDSIPLDDFLRWYEEKYPDSAVVEDITYLVHTRYQVLSSNKMSFLNYRNKEAFLTDVQASHEERIKFKERLHQTLLEIMAKTKSDVNIPLFRGKKRDKKRGSYVLDLAKRVATSFEEGDVEVYLPPENLKESPKVCQAIDLLANKKQISKEEARVSILRGIAKGEIDLDSKYIAQLKICGFTPGEEMSSAVDLICGENMGMARLTNVMFAVANYLIEINSNLEVIDPSSTEVISKLYKILEENI